MENQDSSNGDQGEGNFPSTMEMEPIGAQSIKLILLTGMVVAGVGHDESGESKNCEDRKMAFLPYAGQIAGIHERHWL